MKNHKINDIKTIDQDIITVMKLAGFSDQQYLYRMEGNFGGF